MSSLWSSPSGCTAGAASWRKNIIRQPSVSQSSHSVDCAIFVVLRRSRPNGSPSSSLHRITYQNTRSLVQLAPMLTHSLDIRPTDRPTDTDTTRPACTNCTCFQSSSFRHFFEQLRPAGARTSSEDITLGIHKAGRQNALVEEQCYSSRNCRIEPGEA